MHKVIKYFTDSMDGGHPYHIGDAFPCEGVEVSEERIKELSSANNKRGVALIKAGNATPKVADAPKKGTKNGSSKSAKK